MQKKLSARDQFCGQWAAMIWEAVGNTGKGARRPSFRTGANRGAANGCNGKRHNSPAKVTRRPGLKAAASYATQYSHVLTPLITARRDRKGT